MQRVLWLRVGEEVKVCTTDGVNVKGLPHCLIMELRQVDKRC